MSQGEATAALVDELTEVRRRGLDEIDLELRAQQKRVETPTLEQLARRYTSSQQSARIPLIRQLLDDALTAWSEQGHEDEAHFVRRLFFAPDGGTPGRHRPGHLLQAAREDSGLNEDQFDERRRALFRLFAAFVVVFATAQAASGQAPEKPQLDRRVVWGLAGVGVIVLAVLGVIVIQSLGGDRSPPTGTRTTISPAPSSPATAPLATFTFDSLDPNIQIVNVYPGVGDGAADRTPNGTFTHGSTAPAVCKATGRTVSSDPRVDAEARTSDVWIQVIGQPGQTHYATLVYGEMEPEALEALPSCQN